LAENGIPNLKLYFLIGLPDEGEEDIAEMLELTGRIRDIWVGAGKKQGRLGNITLSVNPFIPKPSTPLQWAPMEAGKSLEGKMKVLRSAVARLPNTEAIFESPRAATVQAFLSRGDRRTARTLPHLAEGKNLKAACRAAGLDPEFYVTRERGEEEVFPWEILDSGVDREYLWQEFQRGSQGKLTPRCMQGCQRCGVCG
jgi:radical SAM superfamily enzyme YgiQ (UPF0313 family)